VKRWRIFPWRRLSACRLDTRVESCAPPVTKPSRRVSTAQPESAPRKRAEIDVNSIGVSGGRSFRYTHPNPMRNLIVAALLAAPAFAGRRQSPAVGGQDRGPVHSGRFRAATLEGILGDRIEVNLEGRLLRVDEKALIDCFQHRPGRRSGRANTPASSCTRRPTPTLQRRRAPQDVDGPHGAQPDRHAVTRRLSGNLHGRQALDELGRVGSQVRPARSGELLPGHRL